MRILLILTFMMIAQIASAQVAKHGTFLHAGETREHFLYLPPQVTSETPLVVALHGLGGNAKNLRFGIGLTKRAQSDSFAVLYPQGIRLPGGARHWNAGFDFSDVDDLGYLDELIAHVRRKHGMTHSQLYVLGISNGGYMAYHMACLSRHNVNAIATVAGTMSESDWYNCPARFPVSILHIHGTEDPMIRFSGVALGMSGWGGAPAVPALARHWAKRLQAAPTYPLTQNNKIVENRYRNPRTGTEVQMLALLGFGHDWPNLSNGNIDALHYVLGFFERVRKPDIRSQ